MSALTEGLELGDLVTIVNARSGFYRGYYRGEDETTVSWSSEQNGPSSGVTLTDYKYNIRRIDKDKPSDADVLREALVDALAYRLSDGWCGDCDGDSLCEDHELDDTIGARYQRLLDAWPDVKL